MRRRVAVWLTVVVAVLVVTASPASAAGTGVKINTTDSDFQQASLTNLDIEGSGESASVVGGVGEQDNVDPSAASTSGTDLEAGVVFSTTQDRDAIYAVGGSTGSDPTTVYLRYHSNGTLITSRTYPGSNALFTIETPIKSGVEYRLTVDDGGDNYFYEMYGNGPLTSGALNVSQGYRGGGTESEIYVWDSLGVGYPTDVEYRGSEHQADADTLFADVNVGGQTTITAQANSGSGWIDVTSTTVSTSQNVSLDVSGSSAERYRTVVEASETGNGYTVEIEDEGVQFQTSDPRLSNPDPADGSDVIDSYDGDISVDVSDPDFGDAEGDTVTVTASNQNGQIGQTSVSSNGTASIDYDPIGGANNITWSASDAYGNSESSGGLSQDFTAPDKITVVNVSDTSQLVDDVEVTVQFFQEDNATVIRRTTSDGRISMTGLEVEEQYLVTAEADGYVTRKAIVQPLGGQERVYLLNQSADSSEVEFVLSDPTGEFPPEETYLYVEKPINDSGSTKYRVITADRFSATGSYPVTLENGARYRLRVVSEGSERALGTYTATGDATEPLQIQRIEPSADERDDGVVYGDYNATSGQLAVRFRGGEPETEVVYNVTDATGGVVVAETTVTGTEFAHVYNLAASPNETASYTVNYEIRRPGGGVVTGSFTVGSLNGISGRFDADPQVLSIASWVAILASMGLVVIVDTTLAPAVGAGMASILTILGTVAIPMPLLGVSGAIGVLVIIGGR